MYKSKNKYLGHMNKIAIITLIVGVMIGIGVGYSIVQPQLNDVNGQLENSKVDLQKSQQELTSIGSAGEKLESALINRNRFESISILFILTMAEGTYEADVDFFVNVESYIKEIGSDQLNTYYDRVMDNIRNGSNQDYIKDRTQFMDQLNIEFELVNDDVNSLLNQIKGEK